MSKVEEISIQALKKWLASLDTLDLIDLETLVLEARERKKNEGRVLMLRVAADGINVGFFMGGEVKGALEYLLAHADDIDSEIRTDFILVPESEVAEKIAWRLWE